MRASKTYAGFKSSPWHKGEKMEHFERITMMRDLKPIIAAFTLPKRFGENGVDLNSLVGTPAFTGEFDQFWLEEMSEANLFVGQPQLEITFATQPINKKEVYERPTDGLADTIRKISVLPDPEKSGGFRLNIDFDLQRFIETAKILQEKGNHLAKVMREILTGRGVIHLETAQQLGHTLRMINLNEQLTIKSDKPGLTFIVPNIDNIKLCSSQLKDGRALSWRQLFEPGYCLDPNLIFPMNPEDKDFFRTVGITAAINRHILAIALGALSLGSEVVWVNDARHEGPALFRAVCDWMSQNKTAVRGKAHMFQLGYLILDPVDDVPEEIKRQALKTKEGLIAKARRLFPGLQIADGVEFMKHKMLAQAIISRICKEQLLPAQAHTIYMTSFGSEELQTQLLDERSHQLIEEQKIIVTPEIAAQPERTTEIGSLVITLGTSGHSLTEAIVQSAAESASASPNVCITLVGKGADEDSVKRILGANLPENLKALGIIPKEDHDRLTAGADVIVIKTTRNTRLLIESAINGKKGILLLPPDINVSTATKSIFEISYLCETLLEHLNDTQVALKTLKELGVTSPEKLILNPNGDLLNQALYSKTVVEIIASGVGKKMGSPADLAEIILKISKGN